MREMEFVRWREEGCGREKGEKEKEDGGFWGAQGKACRGYEFFFLPKLFEADAARRTLLRRKRYVFAARGSATAYRLDKIVDTTRDKTPLPLLALQQGS